MKNALKIQVIFTWVLIITVGIMLRFTFFQPSYAENDHPMAVRSVDTMKLSRDVARAKLDDESFDVEIEKQVREIAGVGASHIAIATPYDPEFLPFLKRWVKAARKYKLKVWFRGNFSGWEGWFEYPEISRTQHTSKTQAFILNNTTLFEDGDIFTSCPECENGGPGDPREGDKEGFRKFIIQEYGVTKAAFKRIKKNVTANYYSMNGDVAKLIMDKKTTAALDGIITVDHYVDTPEQLVEDINEYAELSGGKVVIGEIGVPIPDIHGDMTEREQAEWMAILFAKLRHNPHLVGMNYWVHSGGSTALWDTKGEKRDAADVVKNFYTNRAITGQIINELDAPVGYAKVTSFDDEGISDSRGNFSIPFLYDGQKITISAAGYRTGTKVLSQDDEVLAIVLKASSEEASKESPSFFQRIINFFSNPFGLFK